jgi:predicted ATPase
MVLETFSISHGKASAYLPVIDLLRNYFDISATDDERKRREKVTGRVVALDRSLEDALPYLFALLGIVEGDDPLAQMDGQNKRRRTLEAIKRILLRESLHQPLMVIFEDLHWIDEATQDLLNLLADSIGTAKILLLVNYRPEYSHKWNSKTYYTQLRLDPLGQENAAEMLSALLGDGKDLIPIKRLIIERTEGTPFFMEEIVQSLFEDGVLQRNGTVKLAKPMNAVKVPTTVQGVIASRIDRLSAEDKELLQTLAVLGREFPLELVKHVTLWSEDELGRGLSRLQAGEFIYEQVAESDVEYIFKHALTQEVAHNSLLIERRKLLHERAGRALESMFTVQLDDHLDELAHHYRNSDNVAKAVEYLGRAGQQAAQRSVYADAINRLTAAVDLLQKQQDSPERSQREVILQLALGPALVAVKGGWSAREVERAYARARELCERLGDPSESFTALYGLWAMHALRGELRKAYALAEQLLHRAQITDDPAIVMYARYALGFTSYWMGEFLRAREHLGMTLTGYGFAGDRLLTFIYGFDAGVNSQSYVAWTLWHLGYPDQALRRGNEALALAQKLSHPVDLAFAETSLAAVRQSRREAHRAKENAESALALAVDRGLTEMVPIATALRGWALAEQTRYEHGIEQIQEGLAALRRTGLDLACPYLLSLLAEACNGAEHLDHGRSALIEALESTDEQKNHSHQAELHRLKGELLLAQEPANPAQAEQSRSRVATTMRARCWPKSTTGLPKASTPQT